MFLTDAAKQYLGNRDSWDTEEKCFSIDKDDAIKKHLGLWCF